MAFTLERLGAQAFFVHDGERIMTCEGNVTYFGGFWWVRDQWLEPGGGPEVASVPAFAWLGYENAVCEVTYEVLESGDRLRVAMRPVRTMAGTRALELIDECCTFTVELVDGRYRWTQELRTVAKQDVDVDACEHHNTELRVYRYPRPDGQPGLYMQFADPLPISSSGPAVPMTRDWLWQPEPYVGAEAFRSHWQRRYTDIIFQDPDGSWHHSDLNKRKWHYLLHDNRRARPCHPRGPFYLLRPDGRAMEVTVDASSHYHHVCEWGMDFHCWLDLAPYLDGTIMRAGTVIEAKSTTRLVDAAVVAPVRAAALPMELAPREREVADRPAYEEPVNTFAVSVLERLDAFCWLPTSEGCRWERDGGHTPGHGCLVIHNDFADIGSWRVDSLGPQQWANPFLGRARYRLSAWVRVENFEQYIHEAGPQVGVEFVQSNGPAPLSKWETTPLQWSPPLHTSRRPLPATQDWTYIELITEPCPSFVLYGHLVCQFRGRGTAWFSDVRWEMLQPE